MTRNGDESLSLGERTARVQQCENADLLISIHTNASVSMKAQGIETFFYLHKSSPAHIRLGNDELIGSGILLNNTLDIQSKCLAECVHSELLQGATFRNPSVVDRGIKQEGAQLLLGVEIPAILVELGFLTHPVEGQLLAANEEYTDDLAWAVCLGIEKYFASKVA